MLSQDLESSASSWTSRFVCVEDINAAVSSVDVSIANDIINELEVFKFVHSLATYLVRHSKHCALTTYRLS